MSNFDLSRFDEFSPRQKADASIEQDKALWEKTLHFLNRETAASASFVDELIFDRKPDFSVVDAYLEGIKGRGQTQSFSEILTDLGWDPESRAGKIMKGIVGFGADVGASPSSYLGIGSTARGARGFGQAAKFIGEVTGGSTRASKLSAARQALANEPKAIQDAAEFVFRNIDSTDEAVQKITKKALTGEKLTKVEEAQLGLRHSLALHPLFGEPLTGTKGPLNVALFQTGEALFSELRKAPLISPVADFMGRAFQQYYDLKKKFPKIHKLRKQMENRINHMTADGVRRWMTFTQKLDVNKENTEILQLLERLTETKILEVSEYFKKHPYIWTDLGLTPGQKLTPEQAVRLTDKFFDEQHQWIQEFGPGQLYRGGLARVQIDILSQEVGQRTEAMRLLEEQIPQMRSQGVDTKSVTQQLKQEREIVDGLSDEIARLEKEHVTDFPELNDVLDEEYTRELGTGFFGTVKNAEQLPEFEKLGLGEHVLKLPRSLDAVDTRFQSMVDEHKAYQALNGVTGVGSAELVWKEIPVRRQINEQIAQEMKQLDDTINSIRSQTNDALTTGDIEGLLMRRKELSRKLHQYYAPGFQVMPRKIAGALGPGARKEVVEEFEATTAQGLSGSAQPFSGAHGAFTREKSDGTHVLRMPVLVKPKVDIDQKTTFLFQRGRLGSRTHDKVRQIEKMMAQMSRRGIVLGDMHPDNFVIDKKGKVRVLDLGVTAGPRIESTVGDIISDDDVMRAWFENMHDGFFREIVEQQLLRRSQVDVDDYRRLTEVVKDAFSSGNMATAKKGMAALETFLTQKGYKLSAMKFENVLGTRTGIGKKTRTRIARRLVDRTGMPFAAARALVNQEAKKLSGIRSELGMTNKIVDGQLEKLERTIAVIQEEMANAPSDEMFGLADDLQRLESQRDGLIKLRASSEDVIKTHQKEIEIEVPLDERLSTEGQQAYHFIRNWKDELDQKLLDSGLLTQEWMDGFRKKLGIQHMRHLKKDNYSLIRQFHDILGELDKRIKKTLDPSTATDERLKVKNLLPREIEGTIKEINDRLGREFFESDVGRIMFYTNREVAYEVEKWNYIQHIVDNFGKPAQEIPFVGKNGEDLTKFVADMDNHVVLDTHPLTRSKQIPKELASEIENVIGKLRDDTVSGKLTGYFDKSQNWWKKWQLFVWPGFFLRNLLGAEWQNYLADVRPGATSEGISMLIGPGLKRGALVGGAGGAALGASLDEEDPLAGALLGGSLGAFGGGAGSLARLLKNSHKWGFEAFEGSKKVRGLNMTHQELLDEAIGEGIMSTGQFGAVGDVERSAFTQYMNLPNNPLALLDPRADKNTLVRIGMKVNEQLENGIRMGHYLSKRRQGLSAAEAGASVRRFHFDYDDLSDFERNTLKRVFPFYTWTRNNIPLQVSTFLTRPGKFTAGTKAINQIQSSSGGDAPAGSLVPKWLNENLGVRYQYDKKTNTYEYWLLGSWWPAADVMRMFHPLELAKDMSSPFLKTPVEQIFNHSLFLDRPLEEFPGQQRALLSPEAGKLASEIPGASAVDQLLKQTFGQTPFIEAANIPLEEGVQVRGRGENVLRQLRGVNEARRLLETSARQGKTKGALASLYGKSYGFDPDKAKERRLYDKAKEINFLNREIRKAVRSGRNSQALLLQEQLIMKQRELQLLEMVPTTTSRR